MRKIRLDPDQIRVASFDIDVVKPAEEGTVRAHMTFPNTEYNTCTQGSLCSSPHNCRADDER